LRTLYFARLRKDEIVQRERGKSKFRNLLKKKKLSLNRFFQVLLPINTSVCGDVCIIIYHARNILGGVMTQGKATGIKICQVQFHTGFIPEEETCLKFNKYRNVKVWDTLSQFGL
jgi:hypothetical protein